MDDSQKLTELRRIVDSNDDDSTLFSYLEQAKNVILNRMYPYLDEGVYDDLTVPSKFAWKQVRIAAYFMNKRGAEGETQHIENGIHRNYKSSDVPEDMLWDVFPKVGVVK